MDNFWDTNLILKTYRGSITYGTNIIPSIAKEYNIPESDKDTHGICIPPKDYVLSWNAILGKKRFEQYEDKDIDYVCYSLIKFVQLLKNCNPNIIEMLFLEPRYILHKHKIIDMLIENRHIFLTKKAKHTFSGYAYSQLDKLTTRTARNKAIIWKLRNNLSTTEISKNMTEWNNESSKPYLNETQLEKILRQAIKDCSCDSDLLNSNRVQVVEKFGYETKFAMHVIRLLQVGLQILVEGNLSVHRPNTRELMNIRLGKTPMYEVIDKATHLMSLMEEAYVTSAIPNSIKESEKIHNISIDNLCIDMHEKFWEVGGDHV